MYIVDEGSGDEGDILNQVLISETNIHSVEGLCVCIEDTDAPTQSPTLPPDAPTQSPSQPPDDTPSPTTPPGTQGDPHFKTHGGEMYDVSIKVFWYGVWLLGCLFLCLGYMDPLILHRPVFLVLLVTTFFSFMEAVILS